MLECWSVDVRSCFCHKHGYVSVGCDKLLFRERNVFAFRRMSETVKTSLTKLVDHLSSPFDWYLNDAYSGTGFKGFFHYNIQTFETVDGHDYADWAVYCRPFC